MGKDIKATAQEIVVERGDPNWKLAKIAEILDDPFHDYNLTSSEAEALARASRGVQKDEIAEALSVSRATVYRTLRSGLSKINQVEDEEIQIEDLITFAMKRIRDVLDQ